MNKLIGTVQMTYVMGGISKEKGRPYLQVSNGIEAKFLKLAKDIQLNEDTFSLFERGDTISVQIETDGIDIVVIGFDNH